MNMKFNSMEEKAEFYAKNCHRSTNHYYGDEPYEYHLKLVRDVCAEFKHLLSPEEIDYVYACAWCHDCQEDTRQTFSDVKTNVNEHVAEVSFLLMTPKGRTRKDRHSDQYYTEISKNRIATCIKLADRIANMRHGIKTGNSMAKKYAKEMSHFLGFLNIEEYGFAEMIVELNRLKEEALQMEVA